MHRFAHSTISVVPCHALGLTMWGRPVTGSFETIEPRAQLAYRAESEDIKI